VLLIWTAAHDRSMGKDAFEVEALVCRLSENLGIPLKTNFKSHMKKIEKNHGVVEKGTVSDSDYDSNATTSVSNSPRSSSPPRPISPPRFVGLGVQPEGLLLMAHVAYVPHQTQS
jgi:hypothetical protein